MKTEDRLTIRSKRTKISESGRENSEATLPSDLIFEILSRLPPQSIARCRCVSKLWASMLRRPDFTEVYLTRSLATPKILFACASAGELFIYSSCQPENPHEKSRPVVFATYHMSFPFSYKHRAYVHGFMCLKHDRLLSEGIKETEVLIYNPSTGQSLPLPVVKSLGIWSRLDSFFGYDPIEKQYKVLSLNWSDIGGNKHVNTKYQILTLGTGKVSWRTIESDIDHTSPWGKGICINGVLYYQTWLVMSSSQLSIIVCFDLRSEKFRYIKSMEPSINATLVNYNGKLGLFVCEGNAVVRGTSTSFKFWVLEDAEKQEWSDHTYILPASWQSQVGRFACLILVGVTRTKEFVFCPFPNTKPYVLYYNTKRKTTVKVEIQGTCNGLVNTFLDHVDNIQVF